jgi:hypothetical protein
MVRGVVSPAQSEVRYLKVQSAFRRGRESLEENS